MLILLYQRMFFVKTKNDDFAKLAIYGGKSRRNACISYHQVAVCFTN